MAETKILQGFEGSYSAQDYSQQVKCRQRYLDIVYNDSGGVGEEKKKKTSAGGRNIVSLGVICKFNGTLPQQNDRKAIRGGGRRGGETRNL